MGRFFILWMSCLICFIAKVHVTLACKDGHHQGVSAHDHSHSHHDSHEHAQKKIKTSPSFLKIKIIQRGEISGPLMAIGGETYPYQLKTAHDSYELSFEEYLKKSKKENIEHVLSNVSGKKMEVQGILRQIFTPERGARKVIEVSDFKQIIQEK